MTIQSRVNWPTFFSCVLTAGMFWSISSAHAQALTPAAEQALYEAAKKEGVLTEYVTLSVDIMTKVSNEFSKKYPGIRFEATRLVGTTQYQRFMRETEAKQYIADMLSSSDQPTMADLVERGYIADWRVPTHDRFTPDMRIKSHVYSLTPAYAVFIYNTKKVTPEEVKLLGDWKGLLDPRFKGRIATGLTPGSTPNVSVIHMFLDPKYKDRFGLDFMKALAAQNLHTYNENAILLTQVVAGENDIGIWPFVTGGVGPAWASGAPVRWVTPSLTPVLGTSWQGISQYAVHPNAARLYQNWSASEEGAKAMQDAVGTSTNLLNYPDQTPAAKEPWFTPVKEKYTVDWNEVDRTADSDRAVWDKILKDAR